MELSARSRYRFRLYVYALVIIVAGAVLAGWGVLRTLPAGQGSLASQAPHQGIARLLFWRVALLYVVIAFLIIAATVALHLFYAHRVAGPAHRLGLEAASIGKGELGGGVKLREKDDLMEMADSLNDVAARYRDRMSVISETVGIVEARTRILEERMQAGASGQDLRRAAEDIADAVKRLDAGLSEMHI